MNRIIHYLKMCLLIPRNIFAIAGTLNDMRENLTRIITLTEILLDRETAYQTRLVKLELLRHLDEKKQQLPPNRPEHHAYKVFSQNLEDGIIAEIFRRIGTTEKTFVEFGVGDGRENNTLWLLCQGWKGLWIEGSSEFVKKISDREKYFIETGNLFCKNAFITKDNINELIQEHLQGEVDLLSIDIDGNDYDVLDAIHIVTPRVIVAEINGKYPPPFAWHMPYDPDYVWDGSDGSGMSFQAVFDWAQAHNYRVIASDLSGVNVFLLREDIFENNREKFDYPMSAEALYNAPLYDMFMFLENCHPNKSLKHFQN